MQIRNHRFSKNARLRNKSDFKRVFDRASKSSDGVITVLGRLNRLDNARLGLAISKKCSKHAVERNRIKRLAREKFREIRAELKGVDFIILGRAQAASTPNAELLTAIGRQIQKVHARLCGTS